MSIEDAGEIIRTKVIRPRVRDVVARERLYGELDRGAERKLTVVSAPAGCGKTTLVAAWLSERERDSCWISLDRSDGSGHRFLRYLEAAVDAVLEPEASTKASLGLTALINRLATCGKEMIIALDDYHLAAGGEIHEIVNFLLDRLPQNVHLMVLTRADPPLRLAKLRGQGELVELRVGELQFTVEEAAGFLSSVMGLSLAAEDIALLTARTEGWIAGIQMIGASLRGYDRPSEFLKNLTADNRHVFDYLLEEVLNRLDDGMRVFLLKCSILSRLTANLCEAVTDRADAQELLEYADRNNLFVAPLDEERRWFRLHHLFSDILCSRLVADAEGMRDLHRRAGRWFEDEGLFIEAIDHLIAAGDFERAAELLDRQGDAIMMRSEVEAILRWVDVIPPEIAGRYQSIHVYHAWAALVSGRPLEAVEQVVGVVGSGRLSGIASSIRAFVAMIQGRSTEAMELADRASRQIPGNRHLLHGLSAWTSALALITAGDIEGGEAALDEAYRDALDVGNVLVAVLALSNRGETLAFRGNLLEAEATFRRALSLSVDSEGRSMPVAGAAHLGLAEIARLRGDGEEALRFYRAGIESFQGWFDMGIMDGYVGVARVLLSQGQTAESDAAVAEAERLARGFDVTEFDDRLVEALRCKMLLLAGRIDEARVRMENREPRPEPESSFLVSYVNEMEALMRARLDLAQGDLDSCIGTTDRIVDMARRKELFLLLIDALLISARANWKAGNFDRAFADIVTAVERSAPQRCVQPFVDEGEEMARILYEVRKAGFENDFIGILLSAFPLQERSEAAAVVSATASDESGSVAPLSPREIEVLSLLSEGMSNKEVAAALFVSERTVKWHTSNIYGKLSVTSRTQALAKARQLGILPT